MECVILCYILGAAHHFGHLAHHFGHGVYVPTCDRSHIDPTRHAASPPINLASRSVHLISLSLYSYLADVRLDITKDQLLLMARSD